MRHPRSHAYSRFTLEFLEQLGRAAAGSLGAQISIKALRKADTNQVTAEHRVLQQGWERLKIDGELSDDANTTWAVQRGCLLVGSLPVGMVACMLIFVGARSMLHPKALGNLWECFGAGVAILGAWALILYWSLRVIPRRTIRTFELVDGDFTCTTQRDGRRTYPVATLRSVRAVYSRRGRRVLSWLIRFGGGRWIELDRSTSRAEELVAALEHGRDAESVAKPDRGLI